MIDVFTIEIPRRTWGPHGVAMWDGDRLVKNFWCLSQADAEALTKKIAAALSKHSVEDVRALSAASPLWTRMAPPIFATLKRACGTFPAAQAHNEPPPGVRAPRGFCSALDRLVHVRMHWSLRLQANARNS